MRIKRKQRPKKQLEWLKYEKAVSVEEIDLKY